MQNITLVSTITTISERCIRSAAKKLFAGDEHRIVRDEWAARATVELVNNLFYKNDKFDGTVKTLISNLFETAWYDINYVAGPAFATADIPLSTQLPKEQSVYQQAMVPDENITITTVTYGLYCDFIQALNLLPADIWRSWSISVGARHKYEFNSALVPSRIAVREWDFVRIHQREYTSSRENKFDGVSLDNGYRFMRGNKYETSFFVDGGVLVRYDLPKLGSATFSFGTSRIYNRSPLSALVVLVSTLVKYELITSMTDHSKLTQTEGAMADTADQWKKLDQFLSDAKYNLDLVSRALVSTIGPGIYGDVSLSTLRFGAPFTPQGADRQSFVMPLFQPEPAPEDLEDFKSYHLQETIESKQSIGLYYDVRGYLSGVWSGNIRKLVEHALSQNLAALTYAHTRYMHTDHAPRYLNAAVSLPSVLRDTGLIARIYRKDW
jgi:hypothetical protein